MVRVELGNSSCGNVMRTSLVDCISELEFTFCHISLEDVICEEFFGFFGEFVPISLLVVGVGLYVLIAFISVPTVVMIGL